MLRSYFRQPGVLALLSSALLLAACATPAQDQPAPGVVRIESALPTCSDDGLITVNLSWNEAAGADSYTVLRDSEELTTLAGTEYQDSAGIEAGTEYSYQVRASNTAGEYVSAAELVLVPPAFCTDDDQDPGQPGDDEPGDDPPADDEPGDDEPGDDPPADDEPGDDPPADDEPGDDEPAGNPPGQAVITDIAAVCDSDRNAWLNVSWTAADGAESYVIERDEVLIGEVAADVLTFRDGPVSPGTEYAYRVVAENAHGETEGSSFLYTVPAISCSAHRTRVSVSTQHALAVTEDGELWTWQALPTEWSPARTSVRLFELAGSPTRLDMLTGVLSVAATEISSFALDSAGNVWIWPFTELEDDDDNGNISVSSLSEASPVQLQLPFAAASFSANECELLLTDTAGQVWWLRYNPHENCSDAGGGFVVEGAQQVPGLSSVVKVAVGSGSYYALHADGTVSAWGANHEGQLGMGDWTDRDEPDLIPGLHSVTDLVAADPGVVFALQADGTLLSWGNNDYYQLGRTLTGDDAGQSPGLVMNGVAAVAAGGTHALAATVDGSVWSWGSNSRMELGFDDRNARQTPEELPGISSAVQVFAGNRTSFALTESGTLLAWGDNRTGILGQLEPKQEPTPVVTVLPASVVQTAGGSLNGIALLDNGEVWTWGTDTYALGGRPGADLTGQPGPVSGLPGSVAQVAAGQSSAFAVTVDGGLFAWGQNIFGQLGIGAPITVTEPTEVNLPDVARVASGRDHTVAVTTSGQLYSWGAGYNGKLGLGDSKSHRVPQQVEVPPGVLFTAVATGDDHSLALAADGSIWGWGSNFHDQLGQQGAGEVYAPEPIPGIAGAVAIAASSRGSMALLGGGNVLVWGWNANGILGLDPDEHGTFVREPTPVPELQGAVQIAAGYDFGLARFADGTVRSWGNNRYGQLALGHDQRVIQPQQIAVGPVEAVFAVMDSRSFFVANDGTLWAAGLDADSQLGRGRIRVTAEAVEVVGLPALATTD